MSGVGLLFAPSSGFTFNAFKLSTYQQYGEKRGGGDEWMRGTVNEGCTVHFFEISVIQYFVLVFLYFSICIMCSMCKYVHICILVPLCKIIKIKHAVPNSCHFVGTVSVC